MRTTVCWPSTPSKLPTVTASSRAPSGQLHDEAGVRLVAAQAEPDVADRQRRAVGRQAERLAEVLGYERLVALGPGVDRVPGGGFERGVQPGVRDGDVDRHQRADHVHVDGGRAGVVRPGGGARQREHQGEEAAHHRNVNGRGAEAPTTHDGTLGASVAETW